MNTGIIRDLAFSPDGERIATADNFCTITVWDSNTGQSISQLRGHDRLVSSVAFSPDGKKLCISELGFDGRRLGSRIQAADHPAEGPYAVGAMRGVQP